jgi:membrane protease YdiL (CAAX protease family)
MAIGSLSKNLFIPNLFTWGHFLSMGVSSGDYRDASFDFDAVYNPPDALIGAPISRFLYGFIEGWPAHTIDEEYFEVQPSDVEILLVSGSIDFSTPPQFATEELLPHLTNAEQVILEDMGHTESIWYSQPEARAHLVTTFFDTGEVDASLYEYQPVDFTVDQGWSDLMRIFIIIISIVIAFIIALIWLTIYLVRRRKARTMTSTLETAVGTEEQSYTRRKNISAFVKKYPALCLLVLSVVFAWIPYAPVAAGLLPTGFMQLAALGASLAGIILAAVEGRKGGVRKLLRRVLIWDVDIQWWAFALLFFCPATVVAIYLFDLFGGPAVDWSGVGPSYSILPMMLFLIVFAGLGEEFGWRGYLIPRLQARYNALISSLIVGVTHALWHVPKFFVEGQSQYDWAQDAGLIPAFLGYSVALIAWTILYAWIFNNTKGSVLLAAVFHGAGNAWHGYIDPYRGNFGNLWAFTGMMVVVAAIIVLVAGPEHLSRKNKRNVVELEEG